MLNLCNTIHKAIALVNRVESSQPTPSAMFELEKSFQFAAGHQLKNSKGTCQRRHGHTYLLTIKLRAQALNEQGLMSNMVVDFYSLATPVQAMIDEYLDHHWLNDTLQCESPTMEYIAQWAYRYLKPSMPYLHSISISTMGNCVTYTESTQTT